MRQESYYAFTENPRSIVAKRVSSMGSYYCREDFEQALTSYLVDSKPDNREFRRQELEELCLARGLDTEALLEEIGEMPPAHEKDGGSILSGIPTREELKEELLEMFHELFREFHSPADYMKRIVHNLAPEYDVEKEPVRVIILKKFLAGGLVNDAPYQTGDILKKVRAGLDKETGEAYDRLKKKDRAAFLIPYIDDTIFENIPKFTVCDEFRTLAAILQECVAGGMLAEADVRLCPENESALRRFCGEMLPESSVYCLIQTVSAALSSGTMDGDRAAEQIGAFFRDMEKDLLKTLDTVTYKNKSGKYARISGKYFEKKKTEKDKITDGWRLLRVCNDLAAGRFHPNGQTRRELYHFAIMFGMEYYFDEEKPAAEEGRNSRSEDGEENSTGGRGFDKAGKENGDTGNRESDGAVKENGDTVNRAYDKNRDVEKNLFQDYYNDNLLRILATNQTEGEVDTSIEPEASGEGINYKNYAECIYLYFLRNKEPAAPGERLKAADALIRQCAGCRPKRPVRATRWDYTRVMREDRFRRLMRLDVKEIPQFVADNYVVDKNADKITLASEQFSAFDLSSMLREATAGARAGMTALETDAYLAGDRKRTADPDAARKMREEKKLLENGNYEYRLKERLEAKYSDDKTFMAVVTSLQERLREIRAGRFCASERKQLGWVLCFLAAETDNVTAEMHGVPAETCGASADTAGRKTRGVSAETAGKPAAGVPAKAIDREIRRRLESARARAWENGTPDEVTAAMEEKPIDAAKAIDALRWLGFGIEYEAGKYYPDPEDFRQDDLSDDPPGLWKEKKETGGRGRQKTNKKTSDGLEEQREMILADAVMEIWDQTADRRMRNLIIHKMRYQDRITRNELLALYFQYFITEFQQDPEDEEEARPDRERSEYDWSFGSYGDSENPEEEYFEEDLDVERMRDPEETFELPDLFDVDPALLKNFQKLADKFREGADLLLEEARYQPFSEKNILDMYLLTELYFFAVENCGYMGYRDDISYSPEFE